MVSEWSSQRWGINSDGSFKDSPSDPNSVNYQGNHNQRIDDLIRRGYGNDTIEKWIRYNLQPKPVIQLPKPVIQLATAKGQGKPFDKITLERIEEQEEAFTDSISKPIIGTSALIPLAIIAFLVLKK